jgi:hypothetical protein
MINTFLPINKNHSIKVLLSSTPHSVVFLSKPTFYFFSVRYTGGKKAAQEVAKAVTKTTLPPEVGSTSTMASLTKFSSKTPTEFSKPAAEEINKPDLSGKFLNPKTLNFLGQPVKSTSEQPSLLDLVKGTDKKDTSVLKPNIDGIQIPHLASPKDIPPVFVVVVVCGEEYRRANSEASPIQSYEINHLNIMEFNSKRIFAQFTSANHGLQNNPILDNCFKLDGTPGIQRIAIYGSIRHYSYNDEYKTQGYYIHEKATLALLNNPEYMAIINDLYKSINPNKLIVDRVHVNDSRFFEENGTRTEKMSTQPTQKSNLKITKFIESFEKKDNENENESDN